MVRWLAQLALALRYIHGRKVIHRDVKTSNVFLVPTALDAGGVAGADVRRGFSEHSTSSLGVIQAAVNYTVSLPRTNF